jgi:SAM-dependent methyltransferase
MDGYTAYGTAELAETYDAAYARVGDAAFWRSVAVASGGGPLLELGCGTGRVLIPLAEEGFEVTGLDLSPEMLGACRNKLEACNASVRERVTLVEGDMSDFHLGRDFAAVICPFGSFHHLRTLGAQEASLACCRAHLRPQGLLVLDLYNPSALAPTDQDPEALGEVIVEVTESADGRTVRRWLSACVYDESAGCNECELTYEVVEPHGAAHLLHETFPLRLISHDEVERLLDERGFRIIATYGGTDRSAPSEDSLGMVVVAVRVDG